MSTVIGSMDSWIWKYKFTEPAIVDEIRHWTRYGCQLLLFSSKDRQMFFDIVFVPHHSHYGELIRQCRI